jgi:hypothetical protein
MFLKLKQESSGYPSWVQSEAEKDRYIEVYRRAKGIDLDKASISKNAGQRTLAVGKMGTKSKQDPDKYCIFRKRVL